MCGKINSHKPDVFHLASDLDVTGHACSSARYFRGVALLSGAMDMDKWAVLPN